MKKMLSLLALSASFVALQGCDYHVDKEINPMSSGKNSLSDKTLTLIGKIVTANSYGDNAVFYFDLDGNTNTTDVVARLCYRHARQGARVFDAKIGTQKTLKQWHDYLGGPISKPFWYDSRQKD